MALNIKHDEVERLVEEISSRTGESKTEAVRRALEERRDRLVYRLADSKRAERLHRFSLPRCGRWCRPPRRGAG
jgi:antitoxin VapB